MLTWNPPRPDPKNLFPPASRTSDQFAEKRSASSRGSKLSAVRKNGLKLANTRALRIVRLEVAAVVVVDEMKVAFPP